MELNHFHFANPEWFWGLLAIPSVCALYFFFYHNTTDINKLEHFADKFLIPHLLINSQIAQVSVIKSIILGSLLWICLISAMACPRWSFQEIQDFSADKTLVILLDLSKSMDGDDISPSRMVRARQEIEDLLNLSKDIKIGLIGFAANSHVISTITEDVSNIKHLLPHIGTDLVFVQGSRLLSALKTAEQMLGSSPGTNKSILIVSDGEIADLASSISIISTLAQKNIITSALGIGTEAGVKFIGPDGKFIERDGRILTSKLEKKNLLEMSAVGRGQYFDSNHLDMHTKEIVDQIDSRGNLLEKEGISKTGRQWEDRFYIFVFPVMFVILFWFRKNFSFPVILLVILASSSNAQGASLTDQLFLSKEQRGQKSLEQIEDYNTAAELFNDSYKKGVVYYKAGNFKEAEKYFRNNTRPEVQTNALYNLGNSLAKQDKFEEAIEAYKEALKKDPDNQKVKHNLGVVKLMIVEVKEEKKKEKKKRPPKKDKNDNPGGGGGGDQEEDEEDEDKGGNKEEKKDKDKDKEDNEKDQKEDDKNKGDEKNDHKNSGSDERDQDKNKNGNNKGQKENDKTNSDKGINADQWLDQIPDTSKDFLKTQFYLESQTQNNQSQPNIDPW